MVRKRNRMTLEEHSEIGKDLKIMSDLLGEIAHKLYESYPVRIGDQTLKVQNYVDLLRSALDSQLGKEYPELSNKEFFAMYYPEPSEESGGLSPMEARFIKTLEEKLKEIPPGHKFSLELREK